MLYWEGWHQLSLLGQGLIHVSRGPYVGHMGKKVSQELFEILSKGTDYLGESWGHAIEKNQRVGPWERSS